MVKFLNLETPLMNLRKLSEGGVHGYLSFTLAIFCRTHCSKKGSKGLDGHNQVQLIFVVFVNGNFAKLEVVWLKE